MTLGTLVAGVASMALASLVAGVLVATRVRVARRLALPRSAVGVRHGHAAAREGKGGDGDGRGAAGRTLHEHLHS
jgi:hypothetical protein